MQALLRVILRWIGTHLLTFLLLIAMLIFGNWLHGEVIAWQATKGDAQELGTVQQRLDLYRDGLESQALGRIRSAHGASIDTLERRLAELDTQLRVANKATEGAAWGPAIAAVASGGDLENLVRSRLELAVLDWERQVIVRLLDAMQQRQTWQAAVEKLQGLQRDRIALAERLQADVAARQSLIDAHPVRAYGLGFPEYAEHVRLRRQEKQWRERLRDVDTNIARQAQQVTQLAPSGNEEKGAETASASYPLLSARLDETMGFVREGISERQARLASHWISRLDQPVRKVAPVAAGLLALVIALPVVAKLISFYVLAPLASRQPPVQILADGRMAVSLREQPSGITSGDAPETGRLSAVSLQVAIGPEVDLLVHPDSLQSTGIPGQRQTKWVLDQNLPLSSLAAGLVGLTRVRLSSPGAVIVTARHDPLNEVAALPLPVGAAMVVHSRCLIGVIHPRNRPVLITRHWRLNSLHAWLTFQLRYLVFHGEATLLIQGCRGVRLERAASGRTIRQAATLAFDARACYKTHRCETFWAYFSGQRELLNDSFSGDDTVFVFQEALSCARGTTAGRWRFGGIGDAVLRAFGL